MTSKTCVFLFSVDKQMTTTRKHKMEDENDNINKKRKGDGNEDPDRGLIIVFADDTDIDASLRLPSVATYHGCTINSPLPGIEKSF